MTLHCSVTSQQGCCTLKEAWARWGHIQQGADMSLVLPLCRSELPSSLSKRYLRQEGRESLMRLGLDSAVSLLMRHWAYGSVLPLRNKKGLLIIQLYISATVLQPGQRFDHCGARGGANKPLPAPPCALQWSNLSQGCSKKLGLLGPTPDPQHIMSQVCFHLCQGPSRRLWGKPLRGVPATRGGQCLCLIPETSSHIPLFRFKV